MTLEVLVQICMSTLLDRKDGPLTETYTGDGSFSLNSSVFFCEFHPRRFQLCHSSRPQRLTTREFHVVMAVGGGPGSWFHQCTALTP